MTGLESHFREEMFELNGVVGLTADAVDGNANGGGGRWSLTRAGGRGWCIAALLGMRTSQRRAGGQIAATAIFLATLDKN